MAELHFETRMSDSDALMWNIEKDPLLRSTITVVTFLDQAPDRAVVADKIERGSRVIPRMRQRVIGNPFSLAPPRWEWDTNFDLRYHVRWVNAGGKGTERSVLDIAEPMGMQGFDRARPLWEFVVIEGLEGGRAALIQKLHHAITDGVGGMQIAMLLLDLERDAGLDESDMPPVPDMHVMSPTERTLDAVTHLARRNLGIARRTGGSVTGAALGAVTDPIGTIRGVGEALGSVTRMLAPATEPLSPIMRHRSLSVRFDTLTLSLSGLKAAAKKADGRLNDAFVAGIAGGLARYHHEHGAAVDALRMNMPINIRTESTQNEAGNQFAPARFPVPMTIDDPVERMRAVHDIVVHERGEPALKLVGPMAGVLNRLPITLTTAVFGSMLKGVDFTASNVPGAPLPVYLAGARLESMFPFGPLAGAAVNITLLSNCDHAHLGINSDLVAVPDPDVLHDCLRASFDEILAVA